MMTLLGSAEGEEKPRELLIESIFGREGGSVRKAAGSNGGRRIFLLFKAFL